MFSKIICCPLIGHYYGLQQNESSNVLFGHNNVDAVHANVHCVGRRFGGGPARVGAQKEQPKRERNHLLSQSDAFADVPILFDMSTRREYERSDQNPG